MNPVATVERRGWTKPCPDCRRSIKYTVIKHRDRPMPFFYASDGTEILMRRSGRDRVEKLLAEAANQQRAVETAELEAIWNDILKTAPETASGGDFGLWTYLHCPFCGHAFEYSHGVRNLELRLKEEGVILFDGVVVVDDDHRYRVVVTETG